MENKFTIKDMNLYYGSFHALKGVNLNLPASDGIYWTIRLRQVHPVAFPESNE